MNIFNLLVNDKIQDRNQDKLVRWSGCLLAIVEMSKVVGFFPIEFGYSILIPLLLLPFLLWGIRYKISIVKSILFLIIYIPLNIALANPSPVFRSWSRFFLFVILLIGVSPLLQNERLRLFRRSCFTMFLYVAIPLSALSLVCYFIGINYFRPDKLNWEEDYTTAAGHFGGLFNHSMVLGLMCGISICVCIWKLLNSTAHRSLLGILALMSGGALLFAASRSALISTIIGIIVILYNHTTDKTKFIRLMSKCILVGGLTIPIWSSALWGIMSKNEGNANLGAYGSRTIKFESRLEEISNHPIIGVGFSAIDPKGMDKYDSKEGVIEPGSSWLGIFSMTGVIGLIIVLGIVYSTFRHLNSVPMKKSSLFKGLMSLYCFHLFFEGYIFAGGSLQCFIFWLSVGVSNDIYYENINSSYKNVNLIK